MRQVKEKQSLNKFAIFIWNRRKHSVKDQLILINCRVILCFWQISIKIAKDGERFPGILAHCENNGCFEWNFQQILSYIPVATTQNYNLIRWTFPLLSPRPKCAYKYPIGVTLWALVLDYTIQNRSHFFRITRNHWGLQYCKDMRSRKNLSSYPFEVHSVKNPWKIHIEATLFTFFLR